MSLYKKIFKGTLVMGAGEGLTYICSFGRNMVLARLLAKSDFGIAATFGMVMTILEFSGKLAVSRFVVQDKQGNTPQFIATAHLVQFAASAFSTVSMLIAATPISALFGIEGHQTAFTVLAFFPLLKGLEHLDTARMERELRFTPSSICAVGPQILMTLAAWPVAIWLPDYRAVLVLLAVKGAGTTVATHVLAERPYRWAVNKIYITRMLRFGWPLLLNGFLMFGVFQGDQFLVGHFYSMSDLGTYSAAATLALAPSFICGRILGSMMLPLMAQVQDDVEQFRNRYSLCIQTVATFSAFYSVTTIAAARSWMNIAYGNKYYDGGIILACVAASNVFRIIRFAPATAALAKADSHNQLVSNIFRVVSLAPAALLGWAKQPLWMMACAGLCGEALACSYSLWRLKHRDATPWSTSLGPISLAVFGIIFAGTVNFYSRNLGTWLQAPLALILGLGITLLFVFWFPDLRKKVRASLADIKEKRAA